jgi:hypothetical protein
VDAPGLEEALEQRLRPATDPLDVLEDDGPTVNGLDEAALIARRRRASAQAAEQLDFQQTVRHAAARHNCAGTVRMEALLVKGTGDERFSASGLANHDHEALADGSAEHVRAKPVHRAARANEQREWRTNDFARKLARPDGGSTELGHANGVTEVCKPIASARWVGKNALAYFNAITYGQ